VQDRIRCDCFLLCDHARIENGKLYVLGGGWNRITPHELPLHYNFMIAIWISVRPDALSAPFPLTLDFLTADGTSIDRTTLPDIRDEAPRGERGGAANSFGLALDVDLDLVRAGRYVALLSTGEHELARSAFQVIAPEG
jgi:hypothetical protein